MSDTCWLLLVLLLGKEDVLGKLAEFLPWSDPSLLWLGYKTKNNCLMIGLASTLLENSEKDGIKEVFLKEEVVGLGLTDRIRELAHTMGLVSGGTETQAQASRLGTWFGPPSGFLKNRNWGKERHVSLLVYFVFTNCFFCWSLLQRLPAMVGGLPWAPLSWLNTSLLTFPRSLSLVLDSELPLKTRQKGRNMSLSCPKFVKGCPLSAESSGISKWGPKSSCRRFFRGWDT